MGLSSKLRELEAESISILREVAGEFERPVLLYSIGKDSSVVLRLAQKAFYPEKLPFPLLHIDTGFKFPEMIDFRERLSKENGIQILVWRNEEAIAQKTNPHDHGVQKCCSLLKTKALLDALNFYRFDAAIGGARRDEEKSRAKERIFSFRNRFGQWDPKNQRPELWSLYNTRLSPGESFRVFPLSNWTEIDVWRYIEAEKIQVVPLYFSKPRSILGSSGEVSCRYRTLGCAPCTGAIRSTASTVSEIIEELARANTSERENRLIDHDREGSMEIKKREGYF